MKLEIPVILLKSALFFQTAGEFFLESSPPAGNRFINIRMNAEPPQVFIEEGGTSFGERRASDEPPTFVSANADQRTSINNLPITEWNPFKPVDILVTCTRSDFNVHFNGKLIKSIQYWHDVSDPVEPMPSITKLGWKTINNAKISKVSWTYGKYNTIYTIKIRF